MLKIMLQVIGSTLGKLVNKFITIYIKKWDKIMI